MSLVAWSPDGRPTFTASLPEHFPGIRREILRRYDNRGGVCLEERVFKSGVLNGHKDPAG